MPKRRLDERRKRRNAEHDVVPRVVAIQAGARASIGRQTPRESEGQLRQLAARLQAAREEERAQVARELHDELGQTLTALKLDISRTVAALVEQRLTPSIIDRVQSLVGLSDIALAIVKRIATRLRPPILDHLGLAEAMHWEALAFKARTGLRCQVRRNKTRTNLTGDQQTALFRIFQEALTNIVRHAGASAVQVTLVERDNLFELQIRDNGRGITDVEASNPNSIGLLGMRERAALVGGRFAVSGARGKGTIVSVQVPVPPLRARVQAPRPRKVGAGDR
jgi:signal transduction histidine kinase